MGSYAEEYAKLNKEQKQAVDYIDGPLLVVAGPGTGKTQLLSLRVAKILQVTDADASNILCLTFTNKAATNMRDRLTSLIGIEAAKVNVRTFHSFAGEIMQLYPDYFWSGARLTSVPEAVQREVVQSILSRLPLSSPLAQKFAGQYTLIKDVTDALKLTKEAGITPAELTKQITLNLAYIKKIEPEVMKMLGETLRHSNFDKLQDVIDSLPPQRFDAALEPLRPLNEIMAQSLAEAVSQDEPTGKTKNTGKWKKRWRQTVKGKSGMWNEIARNQWWLELSKVYKLYRQELHNRGYYDYSDMLVEVISILEANADLLASVQERYLYVLIDEFQDTNVAQLKLADLVANHYAQSDRPNLMAVGDDDQAIFKFNGAELNNMLSFKTKYPKAKLVVLEGNYRSTQAVLDVADKVASQISERLITRLPELSKNLRANIELTEGQMELWQYPTQTHELQAVAKAIASARLKEPHKELAALARGHASLQQLAAILLRMGVPVKYEQQANILDQASVSQIYHIAEAAAALASGADNQANAAIAQMLKHPMWQVSPRDLWDFALQQTRDSSWADNMQKSKVKSLAQTAQWLKWLATESRIQPLGIIIEYILGLRVGEHLTSPLQEYYLRRKELSFEYLQTLSAIQQLNTLVKEFVAPQGANLNDFVRFIKLNIDNKTVIADESVFVSGENPVSLLTVYKAKGLEFDSVYIIDANETVWRPVPGGRKPPANLPLKPYGDDLDDYIRLMYVAITRAKRNLVISSVRYDGKGEELLPAPFIRNIMAEKEPASLDAKSTITVLEEQLRWPRLETKNEKMLLKSRLEDFSLSASGLLAFLDVTNGGPQKFLESQLLRLPEATSAASVYGTSMHRALQEAQQLTNQNKFKLQAIEKCFEKEIFQRSLLIEERERYLKKGTETLKRLLNYESFRLPRGSFTELKLENITVGKAKIDGVIDHIYESTEGVTISDYKTGEPISNLETKNKAYQLKAWKHRTQLIFYDLLVKSSGRFPGHSTFANHIIYIDAEEEDQLIRVYEAEASELEQIAKLVQVVWQKVSEADFPDTSAYAQDFSGIEAFIEDLLS